MKDWSDLEEKYQDMRSSNPVDAQSFKQKMTQRFQVCKQFQCYVNLLMRTTFTIYVQNLPQLTFTFFLI